MVFLGIDTKLNRPIAVYHRVLQKLDRKARFRFLDLPPELRELVYRELLHFNRAKRSFADTEILQTSKLVYKKGLPILHEQSTIRIGAIFSWKRSHRRREPDRVSLAYTHDLRGLVSFTDSMTVPKCLRWLQPFANIRAFEIYLSLQSTIRGSTRNWVIPSSPLEAMVEACKKIRYLRVRITGPVSGLPAQTLIRALVPLQDLPSKCVVVLEMNNTAAKDAFWKMVKAAKGKQEQEVDSYVYG